MWIAVIIGVTVIVLIIIVLEKSNRKTKREIEIQTAKAEQGDVQALFELGKLEESWAQYEKAISWYEKASEKGHTEAGNAARILKDKMQKEKDKKEAKAAAKERKKAEKAEWSRRYKEHNDPNSYRCRNCGGSVVAGRKHGWLWCHNCNTPSKIPDFK